MNKKLLITLALALAAGALVMFIVWVASLLSWWLVLLLVYTILIFPTYSAVTIWEEEDCFDMEDFWDALEERRKRLRKKKTPPTSMIEEDDYQKYP